MDWFNRLKIMKQNSGLTTRNIADLSGIPEPTLEKLFAGKTKDPKLNTIKVLVNSLGYTLDDLAPEDKKTTGISSDGKYSGIIEKLDKLTPTQVSRVEGFIDCMIQENEATETAAEQTNVKLA